MMTYQGEYSDDMPLTGCDPSEDWAQADCGLRIGIETAKQDVPQCTRSFDRAIRRPTAREPSAMGSCTGEIGEELRQSVWRLRSEASEITPATPTSPWHIDVNFCKAWQSRTPSDASTGGSDGMQEPMKIKCVGEDLRCSGWHDNFFSNTLNLVTPAYLPSGAEVILDGLVQQSAFNGRKAVVDFFDVYTNRYVVNLIAIPGQPFGNAIAQVKRENLRLIATPSPPSFPSVPDWL
mmetsp:Transcript_83024/g.240209  ORF Transcript_83024/g.240209 Transcript_83024/m.240209 type:complete len:235 (+) Transcript_83024:130-834(+)